MEIFLHYCKVANKDVENSCEDAICIMNHHVSKTLEYQLNVISICYER